MARPLRNAPASAIHHVVNRGNRRAVIFRKDEDYEAFLRVLREARDRSGMRLIAFCLMPNHWHLLLWPPEEVSLSAFMQWLTSTHVRRYHAHYELVGTGHLYQGRFRNTICKNERRLLATVRYIEGNPRAANLVSKASDWRWSSLRLRTTGDPDGLLCPCPIELPSNWAEYVDLMTEERLRARENAGCTSADSSPQTKPS